MSKFFTIIKFNKNIVFVAGTKFIKKSRGRRLHHQKQKKSMVGLVVTSIKCMAELIKQVPHFNFRKNIISVLVPNIDLSYDLEEVSLEELYKN